MEGKAKRTPPPDKEIETPIQARIIFLLYFSTRSLGLAMVQKRSAIAKLPDIIGNHTIAKHIKKDHEKNNRLLRFKLRNRQNI
ncbi:MAG: hypothetical protein EPN39_10265 [Chitinophagaceae bacterium]|jgi:hypothetical protein|nr:MAG: hypothetical protein EPN39_10265 [Chitinophagaceae bacterium]